MRQFVVSTDSSCDLSKEYLSSHGVEVARHTFTVEKNGVMEERLDDFSSEAEAVSFFNELRAGAFSRTSMLNYGKHYEHFLRLARAGATHVLHVTISSGLSPTGTVAARAAADVKRDYPDFDLLVCDPLTATVGQGAIVMRAVECRDAGMTSREALERCNADRLHIQHFIIASDLNYLKKGGRISPAAAAVGGLLGIRPVICFDDAGKLFVREKLRGERKAVSYIKQKLETEGPDETGRVFIVHTDNYPPSEELAAFVRERFGVEPHLSVMGPVIGSHVGPGAFALGYVSKKLRNTF